MENELKVTWKSCVYSQYVAEEWVFLFRKVHTRATDNLLKYCGKTRDDLVSLACFSQIGWIYFKTCAKKMTEIFSKHIYYLDTKKNTSQQEEYLNTIQTLSINVTAWLIINKNAYESEVEYLTKWFEKIL